MFTLVHLFINSIVNTNSGYLETLDMSAKLVFEKINNEFAIIIFEPLQLASNHDPSQMIRQDKFLEEKSY